MMQEGFQGETDKIYPVGLPFYQILFRRGITSPEVNRHKKGSEKDKYYI